MTDPLVGYDAAVEAGKRRLLADGLHAENVAGGLLPDEQYADLIARAVLEAATIEIDCPAYHNVEGEAVFERDDDYTTWQPCRACGGTWRLRVLLPPGEAMNALPAMVCKTCKMPLAGCLACWPRALPPVSGETR